MAHLFALCESAPPSVKRLGHVMYQIQRRWRGLIPAACPLCAGTAQEGELCDRCHALLVGSRRTSAPRCACCCLVLDAQGGCADCTARPPAFDGIIAAFDYCAPGDMLIHRLKVSGRFMDAPMLGRLLAQEVQRAWPDLPPDQVLVPVPASRQAIRRRGFNPAAEVARVLARSLNRRYRPDLLRRMQEGRKQAMLSREARMRATSRLYGVRGDVRGARIAVVDDVLTTGSTMHGIARMLKRCGAASVHGMVLARTPHVLS